MRIVWTLAWPDVAPLGIPFLQQPVRRRHRRDRHSLLLSFSLLKLLCRQYRARVRLQEARERRPPAEAPRGVLSRGEHAGDPLQKLARHHDALVTERERSGARNGVGKVVVPAGRVVDAVPTAARRSAFQPAELGHQTRMIEQLDAVAILTGGMSPRRLAAVLATNVTGNKSSK